MSEPAFLIAPPPAATYLPDDGNSDRRARVPRATIVHQVRGRVRLRIPLLRGNRRACRRIEHHLGGQEGIIEAKASERTASVVASFDSHLLGVADILRSIAEAFASTDGNNLYEEAPAAAGFIGGLASVGLSLLGAPPLLSMGVLALSAAPVFRRARHSLTVEKRLSVDVLDATAIGLLAARGNIVAAGLSTCLIEGGEYIRSLTARRTRRAVGDLLGESRANAWLVQGGRKVRVPAAKISVGDTVIVYSGQLIAVDGTVIVGRGSVDQKALTGESKPVEKKIGDRVYASTVLSDGKLYVKTEAVGNSTRAHRVADLLNTAPVQDTRMADHARIFADRLVLPTMLLSAGVFALTGNLNRAVSILLFDFASGIRVSAPTAVLASMASAARQGILLKGGRALEQLARSDTILFDKTGTLTLGQPTVTEVISYVGGVSEEGVLSLAAATERRLSHPVAQAIVRAAESRSINIPERTDSNFTIGLGVEAEVDGTTILVGDVRFMQRYGVSVNGAATNGNGSGHTAASNVLVARNGVLLGKIVYADVPRPEAKAVIDRLRALGFSQLIMVTGDEGDVAQSVGDILGLDSVEANVCPEDKANLVRGLQQNGHVVAVVGDGINDSPALAYADISISLKGGADIARETADIVLEDDLKGLVRAVELSRGTMNVVRQNLAIIGVPNVAGMALAATGLLGPLGATVMNNGSSIAAAANSLRPLRAGMHPISVSQGGQSA
jgi:P-type Cu2+ transporter